MAIDIDVYLIRSFSLGLIIFSGNLDWGASGSPQSIFFFGSTYIFYLVKHKRTRNLGSQCYSSFSRDRFVKKIVESDLDIQTNANQLLESFFPESWIVSFFSLFLSFSHRSLWGKKLSKEIECRKGMSSRIKGC